ncbi:MAG: hypothetical protein HY904_17455 [Deltaproteobacteria bacterium]|nr:hypothetical protein [Deltaproteobacteria bacterium]
MTRERDSDRPREKRSWREIDRARESGQQRQSPEDRDKERGIQQNGTAYDKYKKNLERLWNTGNMLELLEQRGEVTTARATAAGVAHEEAEPQRPVIKRTPEERAKERDARESLRKAVGPAEVKAAVEGYLAVAKVLPDDMELLSKALASPAERHQAAALRLLDQRANLGADAAARLLKGRLQTVMLTASEPETKTLAESVRAKLG